MIRTGSLGRSVAILRAAWTAVRQHPKLLWFPVIGSLGAIVGSILVGLVAYWVLSGDKPWTGLALPGLMVVFVSSFCGLGWQVSLSWAATEALAGRAWTMRAAGGIALSRASAIATVSVLSTAVGWLLGKMRGGQGSRGFGRQAASALFHGAWWAVTYLVVPVLAREERSGLESVARSAQLFRETWKEAFVGRLLLGWLWLPAIVVAAAPPALCVAFGVESRVLIAIAIAAPILILSVFGLILQALALIYRTALYVFATEGVVPEPFGGDELYEVWHVEE